VLDRSFWAQKKVLITGHTGFKGSWLILLLKHLGAEASGFSLAPPTNPSFFEVGELANLLTHSIEGDIRDQKALEDCFTLVEPEIVIHGAAQPLVRDSYRIPLETCDVNIMGTACLLSVVAKRFASGNTKLKALVNVTTDKCYDNNGSDWGLRECDALGGADIYSASKACSEIITHAYRESFFKGMSGAPLIATARAGNVIGGGDWASDRVVPDCLASFAKGEPVVLRYPLATRPWQHVLNPLIGYLMLAERLFQGEAGFARAFNFGPDQSDVLPVGELVSRLSAKLHGSGMIVDTAAQPYEAPKLSLDSTLARSKLGWQPVVSFDEAIDMIAEWHACYLVNGDVVAMAHDQIARSLAL
jgi:CDP-glucose 4,6-dehydratase